MANGYIGKISAVVTANTSDLSRKLQGAVKDVDRFAQSLNRSVSASAQQATASLEKIFTPLQRLERRLQTALQLNLRTDDEVRKIQQLVSVAEGINKPLERAAGSFSKLSLEVQGAFLPALNRAQDAAVNLSNTLQQQGSVSANSFKQVEQVVNRTTQALQRLTQAQQLASQSLTGNELQFGNPRLFETLTANAAATRRAAALPAAALEDGSIARQVRALQQYQNAAVEAAARVESLRLEPNVNPEVVLAAERRLISLTETARRAGREVETSVANAANRFTASAPQEGPRGLGLFGRTAGTEEERAIQKARQLDAEFRKLPDSAQSGLQGLAGIVGRIADGVQAGTSNAQQLNTVLARLSAGITRAKEASRAFTLVEAPQQPRGLGLFGTQSGTAEERAIQRARELDAAYRKLPQAARDGLAGLGRIAGDIANRVELGKASAEQLEEVLARLKAGIEQASEAPPPPPPTDLGNRLQQAGADRIRRLTGDINIDSRLSLGPDGVQPSAQAQRDIDALASRVGQVRQQLEALPNSLRTQFIPALQQAQQQLIALQNAPGATAQQIENAANAVRRLEQDARRASISLALPSAADSLEAGAVRAYAGQLDAAQRILIQIGETAGGPVTRAYERLRAAQQRFIQQGIAGTPRATRAIDRLQESLARAAASTRRISFSRALREIQRGGDVARGAFGNAQLAIQQAAFAVDDFFSVTGGLDQRIRAAGNNVTQLAFILGGTKGLFIGLAAVITGQVLLAINKFVFRSQEAEDAAEALNTSLDDQRSKVRQLADDYSRLAAEIAKSVAASDGGEDRRRQSQDRQREIRDAVIETIAANSPSVAGLRGAENRARQQREQAATPSQQLRAAAAESAAERSRRSVERIIAGRTERLAERFLARQQAGGPSARLAINAEINNAQREIENTRRRRGLGYLFSERDADIAPLQERIARLRGAQTLIQQRDAESFLLRGQRFADSAAGGLEGVTGFSETQDRLNRLFAEFEATLQGIADGTLSPREVELANQRFAALSAELGVAITTVGGFARALEDGARQLSDTVVQELRGREDQARRAANAAEAEFGAGSSQASAARRDERLIADERRRAERRRQSIDEQISRRRREFEENSLAGRGRLDDVQRAREIARQREIEQDQSRTAADREEARLRRQRLELEQQQSFEQRPEVRDLRQQADRGDVAAQMRIQEIEAASRAREASRSEIESRRLEIQAAARDLGAGQRLGDIGPAQIQQAATNLAQSIAPAFAQLGQELMNARLQGPSRAAMTVSDVNTAEGRRELNRLIRGDDSARDGNLVELQTQSRLLQEIKVAIQAETATVVDL